MPEPERILFSGAVLALILVVMGVRLRYQRRYTMIAGYRRASPAERARYDIDGLTDHLGNGLITLGVLLVPTAYFFARQNRLWAQLFLGLFLSVAVVVVVGRLRFLPEYRFPAPETARRPLHRLLRRLLRLPSPDVSGRPDDRRQAPDGPSPPESGR